MRGLRGDYLGGDALARLQATPATDDDLVALGTKELAAIGLAACGNGAPPVNTAGSSFGDNATGTVVFWARSDTITASTPSASTARAARSRRTFEFSGVVR